MATSKKTTGTKKKSASARNAKSASGAKSAPARSAPPPPPPESLRPELTGFLFLLLAVIVGISFFNTEGAVIAFVAEFLKGMLGWGYYLTAPVFLFASGLLFLRKGPRLEGRVFAALLLPIFFAALAHLLLGELPDGKSFDLQFTTGVLFADGQALSSGGALGGLLAIGLTLALSSFGAWPLLFALFLLCLIFALRGGFSGMRQNAAARGAAVRELFERKVENVEVPELFEAAEEVPAAKPQPIPRLDGPALKPAHGRLEAGGPAAHDLFHGKAPGQGDIGPGAAFAEGQGQHVAGSGGIGPIVLDRRAVQGGGKVAAGEGKHLRFLKEDGGSHDGGLEGRFFPGVPHQDVSELQGIGVHGPAHGHAVPLVAEPAQVLDRGEQALLLKDDHGRSPPSPYASGQLSRSRRSYSVRSMG